MTGIHAVPAQFAQRMGTQRIARHRAHHRHVMSQPGQRDTYVCLGATHMNLQLWRLQQQLVAGRAQAQQQLTETDDTTHISSFTRATSMGHCMACKWTTRGGVAIDYRCHSRPSLP
ncbi:hypothetical protein G6F68_020234 [Rhizopus microsporus]|nr:hypothetical protein G6F68_020234 [Rhizopus microsporus]KAG1473420.1 hypothetical protein G6F54_014374 [Rhizopus delemar]